MTHALQLRPTTSRKPGRYAVLKLYPVLSRLARDQRDIAALIAQGRHHDLLRHLGLLSSAANEAPVVLRTVKIRTPRPTFGWRPAAQKRLNPDPVVSSAPTPKAPGANASKKRLLSGDAAAHVLSFYRRCQDIYRPVVSYSGGRVVHGYSFSRRLNKSEDPSLG